MFDTVLLRTLAITLGLALTSCAEDESADTDRERDPKPSNGQRDGAVKQPDAAAKQPDATAKQPDATAKTDGSASACVLPDDCQSADLGFGVGKLNACCTETITCGLALEATKEQRDTLTDALMLPRGEMCIPRESYFLTYPGSEEKRVVDEQDNEYLLTYECKTAAMLSISYIACCMPNGRCGVSTYGLYDTLAVLVPGGAPFTKPQCVSSVELNAQLRASKFAGLAYLPDTDAPCDYAALDARLTESEPF